MQIPDWIKQIRLEGYKNVFEILPNSKRLHGVETLCGDWNAETIILGKDWGHVECLYERIQNGWGDPYCHDQNMPTNRNIVRVLREIGHDLPIDGSKAKVCGIIYINSYFLLRHDGKFSGLLPNQKRHAEVSKPVFSFALENLPSVQRIICMGDDSYRFACSFFSQECDWRHDLMERKFKRVGGYRIIPSSHLGSRGITNRLLGKSRSECFSAIVEDWKRAFN